MIRARQLRRTFTTKSAGEVEAVAGIDLDVEEGEVVAFLGPNGAGKSTTLRMLTTLLAPSDGHARVAGHDVQQEPAAVRRRIGSIGQGNGAGHYHHVRDELVLQARAYGSGWKAARQRADELLETLDLSALAKRTAGSLSGGQRRRLDIAMGLVHAPPLLFLDEPSTGLDPQNRAHLWAHVMGVRQRSGTTLFLTTHYLDEADTVAERVMVIDHGRVIADDTPDRLKADLAGDRIDLELGSTEDAGHVAELAGKLTRLHGWDTTESVMTLRLHEGPATLPTLLRELATSDVPVRSARASQPTLDDVFLHLTGRSLREDTASPAEEADPTDPVNPETTEAAA